MQYNNNKEGKTRFCNLWECNADCSITYHNLDYQTFNNVQNNLEQCIKRYTFGEKLKTIIMICRKPDKI